MLFLFGTALEQCWKKKLQKVPFLVFWKQSIALNGMFFIPKYNHISQYIFPTMLLYGYENYKLTLM
jgi:hypothetical protein